MSAKIARNWIFCLNVLVAKAWQTSGGSAIVRSLGDTLLVLLLRTLLGAQEPPGGYRPDGRCAADAGRFAVLAAPEPWTIENMAARAFLSRAIFAASIIRRRRRNIATADGDGRSPAASRSRARLEVRTAVSDKTRLRNLQKHYGMTRVASAW